MLGALSERDQSRFLSIALSSRIVIDRMLQVVYAKDKLLWNDVDEVLSEYAEFMHDFAFEDLSTWAKKSSERKKVFKESGYVEHVAIDHVRKRLHLPIKYLAEQAEKIAKTKDKEEIQRCLKWLHALESYSLHRNNEGGCF